MLGHAVTRLCLRRAGRSAARVCSSWPTSTAPLRSPVSIARRGVATPPIRTLTRVTHHVDEVEADGFFEEGGKNEKTDFDGYDEEEVGAAAATVASAEDGFGSEPEEPQNTVVEFTEEEAAKLERLFQKKVLKNEFLSKSERDRLVNMIFLAFYQNLGQSKNDPAMRYQASLEITWLEEWAEALLNGVEEAPLEGTNVVVPKTVDEARRLIKKAVLERVDLHKPLSYIIGSQPFFGCDIHCRAPLLCPRPETEMWTHWYTTECLAKATSQGPPIKVLDVCCGTGCIGVAIAKHVPRAVVTALDLLPEAVEVSRRNASSNGIPDSRYTALLSDMFEVFADKNVGTPSSSSPPPSQVNAYPAMQETKEKGDKSATSNGGGSDDGTQERTNETESASQAQFRAVVNPPTRPKTVIAPELLGSYDVIVSNPPYILPDQYVGLPRNITHWESKMALVGDDYRETRQYLYFQELCECGLKLLKPRRDRDAALRHLPNICIEVGLQARMVASIMERSGAFEDVEVHLDYAQQQRWITANSKH